jgi:hypothetical protein
LGQCEVEAAQNTQHFFFEEILNGLPSRRQRVVKRRYQLLLLAEDESCSRRKFKLGLTCHSGGGGQKTKQEKSKYINEEC